MNPAYPSAGLKLSSLLRNPWQHIRDIMRRLHRSGALDAAHELRIAAVLFDMLDPVMITDANLNIIRVNQAFQEVTGYSAHEVQGRNPGMLKSGRQDNSFYTRMWASLRKDGAWSGEVWDRRKNGHIYPKWMKIAAVKDERGQVSGYVAIFSDISGRKQAEDEIHHLAYYDVLTRLPNRRQLLERMRLAVTASARHGHHGAVLYLDMDKFKTLHGHQSHEYGDILLIEAARRIKACVRDKDTVARLGGDEFAVLIEAIGEHGAEAMQKTALLADKLLHALAEPFLLKGYEYHPTPSIGVSLYSSQDKSADELLKQADTALSQAKDAGRNAVRFFDQATQHELELHAGLEADLYRAIAGRQLQLYYQIQVGAEHRPLGAEALLRWIHPQRGMVSPGVFIPIAEESALIVEIGSWVLETACQQLACWSKHEQMSGLVLAVNISAQQFMRHDFVEQVVAMLRMYAVAPSRLKLELTESVILENVAEMVAKMHELKALGIALSLDDFGTGYSSLSYLKQLPLDQIKIDQSFVRNISSEARDAVMVRSIIDMAQSFGLDVIAEGVETAEQLEFLRLHGCLAYQGYLFGKPVPLDEFEALIRRTE